jgi:hypothetical protein
MRVLLRCTKSGLYYNGWQSCTSNAADAIDFGSVENAKLRAWEETGGSFEVVIHHESGRPDEIVTLGESPGTARDH